MSIQNSTLAEYNFLTSFAINLLELHYQKEVQAHKLPKTVAESNSEVFRHIVSKGCFHISAKEGNTK